MVGGYAPRAREEIVRPRRLIGASGRPLNFTVRRPAVRRSRSIGTVPQWTPVTE
jgi:hypothetical protein